jgi:hypothetical protein
MWIWKEASETSERFAYGLLQTGLRFQLDSWGGGGEVGCDANRLIESTFLLTIMNEVYIFYRNFDPLKFNN